MVLLMSLLVAISCNWIASPQMWGQGHIYEGAGKGNAPPEFALLHMVPCAQLEWLLQSHAARK